MFGIVLINKPEGITSHDVVNRVRRRFQTRRVGHAGTLDPLATGVLVVAVGPATRFLQYLPLEPKVYRGVIQFGVETVSMDREGQVIARSEVPTDLEDRLPNALEPLLGLIEQIPPMHSAIKKDGKPLYEYARKGETVERRPRKVHIDDFQVKLLSKDEATFEVTCSGGTYVRTLAHDLGKNVGCGAHLTALERTRVGRFSLDTSVDLENLATDQIIPLSDALPPMPLVTLDQTAIDDIRMGRQVDCPSGIDHELVGLVDQQGLVFGVAKREGQRLQPECVIPIEASL